MRHGQATHNIDAQARGETALCDPIHTDSELTEEGWCQVREAGKTAVPQLDTLTAIYCSPSRRCRQTFAGATCQDFADRANFVYLDDRLMEPQGSHPCNRRIDLQDLRKCVPASWDLTGVAETNPYEIRNEVHEDLRGRSREWMEVVLSRHEDDNQRIFVVAHHDWIRAWFREHLGLAVSLRNAEVVRAVWPAAAANTP